MKDLLLKYIVHRVPVHTIQQQYQFGSASITVWAKLCRKGMLDYVLDSSQKLRTSSFGASTVGDILKRQLVFGVVERESGKEISSSRS
jgi:hypothetical protein